MSYIKHLKEQLKFNKSKQECYNIAKEVIMTTDIESKQECYNIAKEVIMTTDIERKQNAEVLTPPALAIEMTSKIPEDAWTKKPLPRIFDPCVGKGVFVSIVYDILWDKLRIPNEEERRRTILEDMLYFADINPFNIYVTKLILDPKNKYKLNAYCGNTLEMKFNFKFDIIITNPPFNKGGVRSHTGRLLGEKNETIWPKFLKYELSILKDNGILASVNPLSWLKKSHSLHYMLDNYIVWMLLWDNSQSKLTINAKIPISSFVMINSKNNSKLTHVSSIMKRRNITSYSRTLLSSTYTVPLAYHSIFDKLRTFIAKNKCDLEVLRKTVKIDKKYPKIKLPSGYTLDDSYAVDTYRIADGIIVRKTDFKHPDTTKTKLIIANKSSFAGAFIDDGRLSLCGSDKFYILGDNLDKIKKMLSFRLFKMVAHYTKYRMDFLESCCFDYIPDIRKLHPMNENELYMAIGLSKEEIESF